MGARSNEFAFGRDPVVEIAAMDAAARQIQLVSAKGDPIARVLVVAARLTLRARRG